MTQLRFLPLLASLAASQSSASPPIADLPAQEARLIITCPKHTTLKNLTLGPAFVPGASISRQSDENLHITHIQFPIQWWRWSNLTLSFTPDAAAELELSLTGPWAADSQAREVRKEVLWDEISATGTSIANGSFEHTPEDTPSHWLSPWSPYPQASQWPLDRAQPLRGQRCAAAWHGRPLTQKLQVHPDQPVRLSLHARSATPPDFLPPAKLAQATPAHQACQRLKRGVNLGNCWESNPGETGVHFTPDDIDTIADQGFDHIRVPVAWHHHLPNGAPSAQLLNELEPVLQRALKRELAVLLVWQNHPELMKHPDLRGSAFVEGWNAIARHFQSWPAPLFFNLLNEPCHQLQDHRLNKLYQETIHTIRQSNPKRILVLEPGHWSTVTGLDSLHPPDEDNRLIISIHCYEPFAITHQGASWVGLDSLRGLTFPGPPSHPVQLPQNLQENQILAAWLDAYNHHPPATNPASQAGIRPILGQAAAWSRLFGRPIHIGEFGASRLVDPSSRAAYAKAFRNAAETNRLPWCWWEWKAGFGYWDPTTQTPLLRPALVPE